MRRRAGGREMPPEHLRTFHRAGWPGGDAFEAWRAYMNARQAWAEVHGVTLAEMYLRERDGDDAA